MAIGYEQSHPGRGRRKAGHRTAGMPRTLVICPEIRNPTFNFSLAIKMSVMANGMNKAVLGEKAKGWASDREHAAHVQPCEEDRFPRVAVPANSDGAKP